MKTTTLLLSLLLTGVSASFGATETWTSKDGKSAELELVGVMTIAGEKVGQFKTKDGKTVSIATSKLAEADAAKLEAWTSPAASAKAGAPGAKAPSANPSVYDKILENNLVKLAGKDLKKCNDATHPTKYYLFYQSASWCGPCKAFTPSLVDFYNAKKNDQFELVLLTHDTDAGAMKDYAVTDKMPWPMLKMDKVEKFTKEFKHPGGGIPNLVLTDLQGNILKASYEGETYVGPTVVMDYLGTLLK
jgi:nucleoredoxin